MKILSWNVQGAKRSQVLLELQFLRNTHRPDIVFLLETMINEHNSRRILPRFGFEYYDFVNPTNHSGGLAVLWHNTNLRASVLQKDPRAIHMLVHDLTTKQDSVISGIYAPAQPRDKDVFWHQLFSLHEIICLP